MLDIDALLQPISDDAPSGEDLSFSSEFDLIQEARRSDDPSLDQGEWVTELKTADWNAVSRRCEKLLRENTKDLRLAVWLAEARTQLEGFIGLADGYRLVARLCESYWETVHPEAEDGDQELRIGNLAWLLNQSIQWVRNIPLLDGPRGRFGAAVLEAATRIPASEGDDSRPGPAQVDASRAATSFEFFRRLAEQAPAPLQALKELEAVVDARLGQEGPSFGAIREALGDVVAMALRFASSAGVAVESGDASLPPIEPMAPAHTATPAAPAPAPAATAVPAAAPVFTGEITSRRDALIQLRKVAEFFRRTEPHSPVAYLADKAARWGSMPLHVWLRTVVKDGTTLSQLEEMLDVGVDESSQHDQ